MIDKGNMSNHMNDVDEAIGERCITKEVYYYKSILNVKGY